MGNLSPALLTTQSKRPTVTLLRVSLGSTMIYLRCTHDELWRFSPPGSPAKFLPAVRTTVDSEGKIVVSIRCVSEASPTAAVLWTDGHRALTNGTTYQIISDATQLNIHHYNVSNFLLNNYTCVCRNPLGSQTRQTRLKGNVNPTGVILAQFSELLLFRYNDGEEWCFRTARIFNRAPPLVSLWGPYFPVVIQSWPTSRVSVPYYPQWMKL